MIKNYKFIIGILFSSLLLASCLHDKKNDSRNNIFISNLTDTVIIELLIPDFLNTKLTAQYDSDYMPNGSHVILFYDAIDSYWVNLYTNKIYKNN